MSLSRFFISFAEYRCAIGTTAELVAQSPGASAEKTFSEENGILALLLE
jgi:hypothetical protein